MFWGLAKCLISLLARQYGTTMPCYLQICLKEGLTLQTMLYAYFLHEGLNFTSQNTSLDIDGGV